MKNQNSIVLMQDLSVKEMKTIDGGISWGDVARGLAAFFKGFYDGYNSYKKY